MRFDTILLANMKRAKIRVHYSSTKSTERGRERAYGNMEKCLLCYSVAILPRLLLLSQIVFASDIPLGFACSVMQSFSATIKRDCQLKSSHQSLL